MAIKLETMKKILSVMKDTDKSENKVLTQALGLSGLVYFNDEFITSELTALNITHKVLDHAGMKCVIAETDDTVFVSFRGTVPGYWVNWKRILNIFPKLFMYNIQVHGGFELYYKEYASFVQDHINSINTTKKVIFTGHSLGAAIAALYNIAYVKNSSSITFACPNYLFNNKFSSSESTSYRIMQDFITYIPFSLPLLKWYRSSDTIKIKSQYHYLNPLSYHSLDNYAKSILDI